MIHESTLSFLNKLALNNNKVWFNENKEAYETAKQNFIDVCQHILDGIIHFEPDFYGTEIKKCILRINRDVRFSKDKSPYKTYFAAGFGKGGKSSGLADYYFHLEPNASFIGGGMWDASKEKLASFRQEVDYNPEKIKNIIYTSKFKASFGEPQGKKLKTSPRGYEADHPEIELLRYKDLFFKHNITNEELKSKDLANKVITKSKELKPLLDFVNFELEA